MNLNRSLQKYQKSKLWHLVAASDRNAIRGMTLVETTVVAAVSSLVIGMIVVASTTASLWFGLLTNYVDMDGRSRNALDQMSLKVRQAGALTEFTPTHVKFALPGQTNSFLTYDWDSSTGSLMEWRTGDSTTNTLLTECNQLTFSMCNASFGTTTNLSQARALSVNWNCSRTLVSRKSTEEMQQALIVLRNSNKPL